MRSRSSTGARSWTRGGTAPAALEDHRGGELFMVFPTIKHLEQL